MKIVPVNHGLEELVGQSLAPRSPGLHMSQLYGALYEELEPKRYRGGEPDPLRLEAGLALEGILEEGLKRRLVERPGEFTTEEHGTPIIYSPDLIIFNGNTRIGEIKLTWLSTRYVPREPSNNFPEKFGKYVTQMAVYCRALETPYARLIGFFVNGDYRYHKRPDGTSYPTGPELLAWDITFTKREMDEEWRATMNAGRRAGLL